MLFGGKLLTNNMLLRDVLDKRLAEDKEGEEVKSGEPFRRFTFHLMIFQNRY